MTTPLEELIEAMARKICEATGDDWMREGPGGLGSAYAPIVDAALFAIDSLGLVIVPGKATVTMCKAALDVVVCYDGPRTEDEAALLEIGPQWDAMLAASPYRRA